MSRKKIVPIVILLCAAFTSASVLTIANRPSNNKSSQQNPIAPRQQQGAQSVHIDANGAAVVPSAVLAAASQQTAAAQVSGSVPEHVIYWHLFHHINVLNRQAAEAESRGEDATSIRTYYKREANLEEMQSVTMNQIAVDSEQEVLTIDAQAKQLISAYRGAHPGGLMNQGDTLPPPPPELAGLQEQRNAAILRGRDRLQNAFGTTEFQRFQSFVSEKVAPQIRPQSMNTLRPATQSAEPRQPQLMQPSQPGVSATQPNSPKN